uniref:Mucin-like protein n=1 Tax=Dermacentor variabilis TaxID=34621 RepID=B7SP50_DERVA|nr:mucin-like protein [Dermacentor variabilis]
MLTKVRVPVLVAFVVVVTSVSAVTADESMVCPIVDDKGVNATMFPNVYDCSTYYICAQGVPILKECPLPLLFNRELNVCDFPWRAACVELPLPEPKSPTTEAPPATEKIIITQVVKQIIKTVDDETPSS